MVQPIFDQFEYDANYTTNFTHGVEEQAERFVHHNGLKIAGIAAVAYILYKTFFKSSATSVLSTTNACTCNCGQKGLQQVQYPVWVPPTIMQQQPLVQKEASQMNEIYTLSNSEMPIPKQVRETAAQQLMRVLVQTESPWVNLKKPLLTLEALQHIFDYVRINGDTEVKEAIVPIFRASRDGW